MNPRPVIRMISPALVGLSLAPWAAAKVYTTCNRSANDWFILVTKDSTGSVSVVDYLKAKPGESCAFKGTPPALAPVAKQIFAILPGMEVRLNFGPEDSKGRDYKIQFHVYDKEGENGSFRYVQEGKGGDDSPMRRDKVEQYGWLPGNKDAVEVREMLQTITFSLPSWGTFDSWNSSLDPRIQAKPKAKAAPRLTETASPSASVRSEAASTGMTLDEIFNFVLDSPRSRPADPGTKSLSAEKQEAVEGKASSGAGGEDD